MRSRAFDRRSRFEAIWPGQGPVSANLLNSSYVGLAVVSKSDCGRVAGLTAQNSLLSAADRC